MSVYSGPEIVNDNSLVLSYDMRNTQKSFRGGPMPNLYSKNNSNVNINQFNGWDMPGVPGAVSEITTAYGAWNANTIWRVTVGTGSIPGFASWRNCVSGSFDVTYGTTRRLTAKVKMISGSITSLGVHTGGGNSGHTYTAISPNDVPPDIIDRTGWFLLDVNLSGSYPSGHCVGIAVFSQNIQFIVAEMMLYPSAFQVPYTPTERTNTETIVDQTGINTITANSLTYASDSTFSFNGSSNFLTTTPRARTTAVTMSVVFRTSSVTTDQGVRQYIYTQQQNPATAPGALPYQQRQGIFIAGNVVQAQWFNTSDSAGSHSTAATIAANTWYNVTWTLNGSDSRIYINGVLDSTASSPAKATTANDAKIGRRGDGNGDDWFNGTIALVQEYTRALTDLEVLQNFRAIRAGYGL